MDFSRSEISSTYYYLMMRRSTEHIFFLEIVEGITKLNDSSENYHRSNGMIKFSSHILNFISHRKRLFEGVRVVIDVVL